MNKSTWLLTCSLLACPLCVQAEPLRPVNQTFHASLGMFFLDTDTNVRLDGEAGRIGTEVDFEKDLGLESSDRFRIDGYWRFLERHKLRFMYFDSRSQASRNITEQIHFGETTFPINVNVNADLDIQIIELAYEYSFVKRDTFELSGTVGLHNLKVKAGLHAAAASNVGLGGIDLEEAADGDGPLPVFGLRGIWAFSDQLYLDAQAQFFSLKFEDYDGNLQDYKLSLNWQPLRNFGIGIGYNDFSTQLDVDKQHFNGKLRFDYHGPLLFVIGAF